MITDLAERRKGRAAALVRCRRRARGDRRGHRRRSSMRGASRTRFPGRFCRAWPRPSASAQRIEVVSTEASYRIERTPERGWVMRDRGDYPVAAWAARATDASARSSCAIVRRMTSDPSKHERLGVDDPREGGRGVLVRVESGNTARCSWI